MIKLIFKMKKYIILIALCMFSCGKSNNKEISQTTNKGDILCTKADKLKKSFIDNDYLSFFNSFPNSFYEFNSLYGYDDKKGEKPLYEDYYNHINFLFDSVCVNKHLFNQKIINVAINGKWEADATSLFQKNIFNLVLYDTKDVLNILSEKSFEETKSFWRYLFDGPHPSDNMNKERFEKVFFKVKKINPTQAKYMKDEYEELIREEKLW